MEAQIISHTKFMTKVKINVTKIDKTATFIGAKGTYLDIVLIENKNGRDQYDNDGFVVQELPKARREAGEKGPIIGNYRLLESSQSQAAKNAPQSQTALQDSDDVPF